VDDVVPISGNALERVLVEQMMDVDSAEPIMHRLSRIGISRHDLKEVVGGIAFEEELYDYCRGEILLPAMGKVLGSLVAKAQGGSITAIRTYLELMKKLNAKVDVNVNMLQYNGLSDSELDRRLQSELRKAGVDVGEDNGHIEAEFKPSESLSEGETFDETRRSEEGEGGEEAGEGHRGVQASPETGGVS
jgi:hypothetical protein